MPLRGADRVEIEEPKRLHSCVLCFAVGASKYPRMPGPKMRERRPMSDQAYWS